MTRTKKVAAVKEVVVAYKGFDADMKCRGFQYAVGESYTHDGKVSACESGFHACEYPLHVLRYYKPRSSRFAIVEQAGELSRRGDDTKIASSKITVKAEVNLAGLIKAAVEYTTSRAKPIKGGNTRAKNGAATASGDSGAATASGDSGAATASGDSGAATASGYCGAATASGYYGAATASGYCGAATASGYYGAATASGYCGAATASGDSGAATASGDSGAATASGYCGAATASGDSGAATASGDSGAATASGYCGAATASGYYGAATASGYCGAATASGDSGAATASGDSGAATASGYYGKVRGKNGCALFLVERGRNWEIISVWAGIAGRDGIKPDAWYQLKNGKPVEAA